VEFAVHIVNGAPLRSLFAVSSETVKQADGSVLLKIKHGAMFSNWIGIRRRLEKITGVDKVTVDLSEATFVDHTVMDKLHAMQRDLAQKNVSLELLGLDGHRAVSRHPFATRKLSRAA
jgi:MFS superfamily sulfate permease-like transporter